MTTLKRNKNLKEIIRDIRTKNVKVKKLNNPSRAKKSKKKIQRKNTKKPDLILAYNKDIISRNIQISSPLTN